MKQCYIRIKKCCQKEEGQVTVMLTLLFFVLLTTVLVSLEIIRYEQAKGRVNHLAVGAVENLMADYQPDMANWYDIYTLDMDYLGQGKEVANNRVWNYLENNLLNVDLLGRERGFYHFTVVDAQVEPVKYLYDEGCLPLKEQIHNWVVESFVPTKKRIKRENIKKMSKSQSSFDVPISGTVPEGVDPRGVMDEIKRLGILTVTANDRLPLSKESHDLEGLPSKSLSWNPVSSTILDKAQEKTELELYILGHFQSALSMTREEETAYSNEIEYLITGKSSDYDCLERVAKEIVALRLPINTASIMKDSSKKGEAGVAAGIICAITIQPEIYEEVKQGILLAWAFGESVADVKSLLQGEKVPLVKNSDNWKLSFHQLFSIKSSQGKESKEGLEYEDYLKLLLMMRSEKHLYMRMLDLMELNIHLKYPEFQIENCITSYHLTSEIDVDRRFYQLPFQKGKQYKFYIAQDGNYQF